MAQVADGNNTGNLISKEAMALDALIRLNRQIAEEPDIYALVNFFLLTVVGQFSVSDSFLTIPNPSKISDRPLFFATGSFVNDKEVADSEFLNTLLDMFETNSGPGVQATTSLTGKQARALKIGGDKKAELILPLIRDNEPFGILGLAGKVTGKIFTHSDIALLQGLLDAIVPFLSNLRREYFDLFNSTSQGVMIFDSNYRLKRINETALRFLNAASSGKVSLNTVHGMKLHEILPDPPFHEWAASILRTISTSRGGQIQNLLARENESERVYDVRVSQVNRMTDRQFDLLLVLDDVTLRRDGEIRLYELQRNAEKGVMISSISHEMKNYLGILSGGHELTMHYFRQGEVEKALDKLAGFGEHINTMREFVVRVMNSSRSETRMSRIDLNAVVAETVAFAKIQKSFRSVRVRLTRDDNLPLITADPDRIAQLLLNLLNNAADAIEESASPHGLIDVETRVEPGNKVAMIVSDNGIGMIPQVREKLFVSQVTTKDTGFGYGLLTCASIMQEHRATAEVRSEPDQGTMITIRFISADEMEHRIPSAGTTAKTSTR